MKKINTKIKCQIVDLYLSGNSMQKVSEILDISIESVKRYLKKGDIPIRSNIKYHINENFFSKIDNEKSAYWLGFTMADGYVAQIRKKKMYKNGTSLHSRLYVRLKDDDYVHLQKMANDMDSNHPVKFRTNQKEDRTQRVCSLEIHNKQIVSDLIKVGCVQKKSLILEYPEIPIDMNRHFIRGFFDGDGTIYATQKGRTYAKFCSASKIFVKSLKSILFSAGIETGSICKGDNVWLLAILTKSLKPFFKYIYNDSNTYLARKHDRYKKWDSCQKK